MFSRNRVTRSFDRRQPSPTAEPLESRMMLASISALFFNSNFWGATSRVFPADPNPEDADISGNADNGVGSISLDGVHHDPADPTGVAVRDPDAIESLAPPDVFRLHFDGAPAAGIRADNFSALYTGRFRIPDDGDDTPNEDVSVAFIANTDDDGHLYVDGDLVSTDPGAHPARNAVNVAPARTYRENTAVDFVLLHADQPGSADAAVLWSINGAPPVPVPMTHISAGPTLPDRPGLTLTGTTHHQVSFSISDDSTSEQRFELWRKPAAEPDSAYVKINDVGINAPFVNDATVLPGTSYTYTLRTVYFLGAGLASDPVTVTTAPPPPPVVLSGLDAYSFNDDWWARSSEVRPSPRLDTFFVGTGARLTGADVHQFVPGADLVFGDNEHDPSVRPGGSPHPQIRDNSHSTVLTGKLVITEPGEYQVLLQSDDDGLVVVDNVITSADLSTHTLRDPRVDLPILDRFTNPITLTAGEHDLTIFHSEQAASSGLRLTWIRPGQTVPELVPAANLHAITPPPAAPSAIQVTDPRGTSAVVSFQDNAPSELKNLVEVATDAAFTRNVRRVPVGIRVTTGAPFANPTSVRVFGLSPGTHYFVRVTAMNFEGSASAVAEFNSGPEQPPAAPTTLAGRAISPDKVRLTWTDNAFDELGFRVSRRIGFTGDFVEVATLPADTRAYVDTLPPGTPPGTAIYYQIVAFNNAGDSTPASNATGIVAGGAGGTGLRRRAWTSLDQSLNNDNLLDNVLCIVGEPARSGDGSAQAPVIDDVSGVTVAGIPGDTIAAEWVGEIQAEEFKAYEFSIITSDGGRLFINDVEVIDGAWRDQPESESFSEPIILTAGQKVRVRLQMYARGGGATARLRWNGPGNAREDVPVSFMFPTVAANDAVAQVPLRPVSYPEVFWLPVQPDGTRRVALRWQDNAFGEAGYEVQRATNSTFSGAVTIVTANSGPGQDLVIDSSNPDPNRDHYYRVRPVGAPDSAWVNAGSAHADPGLGSDDSFDVFSFATPEMVTLNNRASVTAEGSLKLTHNQSDRWATAYINRAVDIGRDFRVSYDQQVGNSSGADGMGFVIHNATATSPAGIDAVPLRALGGGGGAMGLAGITNSVAILFDFHDGLDAFGVYTNGQVPPAGPLSNHQLRDNSAGAVHEPNGDIDLRNAGNNLDGVGSLNIEDNTTWRVDLEYDDEAGLLTVRLGRVSFVGSVTPLHTSKWHVNVAETIGTREAVMGWGAGTGGPSARMEVRKFTYEGERVVCHCDPLVEEVCVRGSAWSTAFKTYMEAQGLGDDVYGYRVDNKTGEQAMLPWVNVNEIILRANAPMTLRPEVIAVTGDRPGGNYTVTTVNQLDPQTFVLVLDRPLGSLSTGGENGVRVDVTIPGIGIGGGNYTLRLNALQGDVNHASEVTHSVVAADFSDVKNRFFRSTAAPGPAGPSQYTVFHDVDGSGGILANDFSFVKARFFDSLQTTPFPLVVPQTALFTNKRLKSIVADLL